MQITDGGVQSVHTLDAVQDRDGPGVSADLLAGSHSECFQALAKATGHVPRGHGRCDWIMDTTEGHSVLMKKARVLIVDDAALIRRIITDALSAEPTIEVAGEAEDGRTALLRIAQLKPDLVTLDIELPGMNGLETLREIRKAYPRLPVIMFSAFTERGAADTLEALHNGASDYVTKPASSGGKALAKERICQDLIPKIRSLCRVGPEAGTGRAGAAPKPFSMRPLGTATRADAVAIAVSTGGPQALTTILSKLRPDFPAPIFIVQHMPNMFTRLLAERLDGQTSLTVVEATDGQVVKPGTVYIAPGDAHLMVKRRGADIVTVLGQDAPEHGRRPAADVLFRSVAETYRAHGLGLVLTGMGEDALLGSQRIAGAGGRIVVQDEATSTVWEMAGRIVGAGLSDAVLPIGDMAAELVRRTTSGGLTDIAAAASGRARHVN
jgi:two-component system, chemotaxis family, protein-glutamate methylesterase/glutaminase